MSMYVKDSLKTRLVKAFFHIIKTVSFTDTSLPSDNLNIAAKFNV